MPNFAEYPDSFVLRPILAEYTSEELFAQVTLAKTDPFIAQKMAHVQKQCYAVIEKIIKDVAEKLEHVDSAVAKVGVQPTSVAALTSAARHRQRMGEQKRELAKQIVIGAVINHDNPDWDPLDPATHRRKENDGLVALMEMAPYVPPAPPQS